MWRSTDLNTLLTSVTDAFLLFCLNDDHCGGDCLWTLNPLAEANAANGEPVVFSSIQHLNYANVLLINL